MSITSLGGFDNIFNICNNYDPVTLLPESVDELKIDVMASVIKGNFLNFIKQVNKGHDYWGKFGNELWYTYGSNFNFDYHGQDVYAQYMSKKHDFSEYSKQQGQGNSSSGNGEQ